jgi:hypothetical protein
MLTRSLSSLYVVLFTLSASCGDMEVDDTSEAEHIEDELLTEVLTSSTAFQSVMFPTKAGGTFVVELDATPLANGLNAVTGVGAGASTSFSQLAATVRFSSTGAIEARSGSAYVPTTATYRAGVTYRIKMTISLTTRTYAVAITPAGGATTTLAGLAFRTEQSAATSLGAVTVWSGVGSQRVATINAYYPTPATPTGLVATAGTDRIDLRWNAATGVNGVTSYRVYRGTSLLQTVSGTTASDTGLAAGTTHTYQVAAVDPYGTSSFLSIAATATTAPSTTGGSYTSSPTFQTIALPARTSGTFVVSYDATPLAASMDGLTGVTNGTASVVTQLAAIVRFNTQNRIDARNGSAYAPSTLAYAANTTYRIEMTLRFADHTYDVSVTPAGGSKVVLGTGLAFRSEQSAVTRLDGLALWATIGSHRVANITSTVISSTDPVPPPPTGSSIELADIMGQAQAGVPFAQQSGFHAQVMGTSFSAASIPESGIHGSTLPNGETLRLGKVTDPTSAVRKALAFQVHPNDPTTSGSKRSELGFNSNIQYNKVYWVALSVYVYDWGTLASGDASLFGTQMHSGNNSLGLSPSFGIYAMPGGRNFQVQGRYSTSSSPSQSNSSTVRFGERPIPFGRWVDFVFKFRHNIGSSGFLQVWMDGASIVDYSGPLGFSTPGYNDYSKFGYYNWSSFNSARKVLVRSPLIVQDPTGSKYAPADLRAFVSAR